MPRWTSNPVVNLSLDPEAAEFLRQKVGTPRGYGRYVSLLLHREAMREELREELARQAKEMTHHVDSVVHK